MHVFFASRTPWLDKRKNSYMSTSLWDARYNRASDRERTNQVLFNLFMRFFAPTRFFSYILQNQERRVSFFGGGHIGATITRTSRMIKQVTELIDVMTTASDGAGSGVCKTSSKLWRWMCGNVVSPSDGTRDALWCCWNSEKYDICIHECTSTMIAIENNRVYWVCFVLKRNQACISGQRSCDKKHTDCDRI